MSLFARLKEHQEDPKVRERCKEYIEIAKNSSGFENAAAFEAAIESGKLSESFRYQLETWKNLEEIAAQN